MLSKLIGKTIGKTLSYATYGAMYAGYGTGIMLKKVVKFPIQVTTSLKEEFIKTTSEIYLKNHFKRDTETLTKATEAVEGLKETVLNDSLKEIKENVS